MSKDRLLSIGEFAAATQLSPKALRLYDEQRLLQPAKVDSSNGYRFYATDQVPKGRLVRALREMGITLAEAAQVLHAPDRHAERLLRHLSSEQDRRHAREKRAYHAVVGMMHGAAAAAHLEIFERRRDRELLAVREIAACRADFIERFWTERNALLGQLAKRRLVVAGRCRCVFVEPLSDEPGRIEIHAPIVAGMEETEVDGSSFRIGPATSLAFIRIEPQGTHFPELAGALDALFDWFDRRAVRAIGAPALSMTEEADAPLEVEWSFETEQ